VKITYSEELTQLFSVPGCWVILYGLYPVWVSRYACLVDAMSQEFYFFATKVTLSGVEGKACPGEFADDSIQMMQVFLKGFGVYEDIVDIKHDIFRGTTTQC
jgi:hypothetical protein